MHELDAIRRMCCHAPRSPRQKNTLFTCDAELVELETGLYGLSLDDFSPEEDRLPSTDPEALGENLAVAVIADVLAAGCIPEFYMHAVIAPVNDNAFCEHLARGVQSVLAGNNCFLLGGDYGRARSPGEWRYTGFAMGKAGKRGALTRVLPPEPQTLWMTGTAGDGNAHALQGTMPCFEPRFAEARIVRDKATACMDTSGGLVESLLTLALCNPGHRLDILADAVPFDPAALRAASGAGIPHAAFAFAGAGEYELLFTLPEGETVSCATRIGTAAPAEHTTPGAYWNGNKLPDRLPDARSFADLQAYIRHVLEVARTCAR